MNTYANLEYEDYNKVSSNYVKMRVPIGTDTYIKSIPNAKSANVLDAGCGTGNYTAVLAPFVGKITGFEVSEGMREQAKNKTEGMDNVTIMEGNLLKKLPFEEETFDAIIINQVTHHLVKDSDWSNIENLVKEFARVLKKGGVLMMNASTAEQDGPANWPIGIAWHLFEKYVTKHFPTQEEYEGFFKNAGLELEIIPATELFCRDETFFNMTGVFDSTWR
jgi:ubiquinone/menaquinone biosynthesis C-methylase UbiE